METAGITAGLGCAVAAAVCFELGYVVQAGAARDVGDDDAPLLLRLARRRTWLGGTALVIVGLVLELVALRLAPLSVVQPALVLGLGLLVVLAQRRLGERLGRRGYLAVAAAGLGVLLIALGGDTRGTEPSGGHPVIVLAIFSGVVFAVLAGAYLGHQPRLMVLAAGLGEAWAVIAAKVAVTDLADDKLLAAAGWGAAAGVAVLLALNAEMTGLQRVPASVVGPLVLATQAAVPVLLAPLAVGEHWASPPAVLAGLALVVAAASVLGSARISQPAPT
jgi:hypothetical protein